MSETAVVSALEFDVPSEEEWGLETDADLERARALIGPAKDSLEHRIALGKILYSLRQRGVSQKRQSSALELPRSRVTMLQRIGSFHA